MQLRLLVILIAAALGMAACGKNEPQKQQLPSTGSSAAPAQPQTKSSDTTPANLGQPQSTAEQREGANPTQQQIDPKEPAQHRDFQQRGDAAGPRSAETSPGPGK